MQIGEFNTIDFRMLLSIYSQPEAERSVGNYCEQLHILRESQLQIIELPQDRWKLLWLVTCSRLALEQRFHSESTIVFCFDLIALEGRWLFLGVQNGYILVVIKNHDVILL